MKLFIGLGNPGAEYKKTRHNIGFGAIDHIVNDLGCSNSWKKKFESEYIETRQEHEKILFIKPLTYMNESGRSVRQWMDYYNIAPSEVYVLYDDMDIQFNKMKLKTGGSAGGHNGIKSLIEQLGTDQFHRIRLGIGRPTHIGMIEYVLGKFSKDDIETLQEGVFVQVADLFNRLSTTSFQDLMARYNKREKDK